jgi:hypothetical protein
VSSAERLSASTNLVADGSWSEAEHVACASGTVGEFVAGRKTGWVLLVRNHFWRWSCDLSHNGEILRLLMDQPPNVAATHSTQQAECPASLLWT